ncbi:restriction endonuclease subunit S [Streptomyces sioyaensis]|uniref:restriction endonuclease subunit S n=1 Tax=Streptomyces sioyaensis TaxID=67364 RepID=UPI003EB76F48
MPRDFSGSRWSEMTIGEVAEKAPGSTTIGPFGSSLVAGDYQSSGVPVTFVRDIKTSGFDWKSGVFVSNEKARELRAHEVRPGDLLATKMGLPPCIAAEYPETMDPGVITADVIRVRPDTSVTTAAWLALVINQPAFEAQVRAITAGVTRPKVTLGDFRNLSVPIPPMTEQQRIIEILGAVDEEMLSLDRVIAKLRTLQSGIIEEATGSLEAVSDTVELGSLLHRIDAGWSPLCEERTPASNEWGVLKVSAVTSGNYLSTESKALPPGMPPRRDIEVHAGDVLMSRANGVRRLVGVTAFVEKTPERLMLSDKIMRLVPNRARITPMFLHLVCMSSAVRRQIDALLSGSSGQNNISQGFIRSMRVPNADLDDQHAVVAGVEAAEAVIASEVRRRAKLQSFKQALMDDLFAGRVMALRDSEG